MRHRVLELKMEAPRCVKNVWTAYSNSNKNMIYSLLDNINLFTVTSADKYEHVLKFLLNQTIFLLNISTTSVYVISSEGNILLYVIFRLVYQICKN